MSEVTRFALNCVRDALLEGAQLTWIIRHRLANTVTSAADALEAKDREIAELKAENARLKEAGVDNARWRIVGTQVIMFFDEFGGNSHTPTSDWDGAYTDIKQLLAGEEQ